MLSRALGIPRLELYLRDEPVPEDAVSRFVAQIAQRSTGLPLQYLVGDAGFYGRTFSVAPGVFIPRPETEAVVDAAVQMLRRRAETVGRPLRLLDLGTGSGCIAVTLAAELPPCVVVGLELSWDAVRSAQANIRRHRLADRVHLVQGSWAEPIRGRWDGMVANPPYIPSAQVECLPLEVRREPRLSLDGGPDGLRALHTILAQAGRLLLPGGVLICECGETQAEGVAEDAAHRAWAATARILTDLTQRPRGVVIIAGDGDIAH